MCRYDVITGADDFTKSTALLLGAHLEITGDAPSSYWRSSSQIMGRLAQHG